MKLFTKDINQKLFAQYRIGSNLNNQKVVAKIFNPYGEGRWYLLNSDPNDPDYLWAIVKMGDNVEIGSVSRSELERVRIKPFGLPLERDIYFTERVAIEVLEGLEKGQTFAAGGMIPGRWYKDNSNKEFRYIGESQGKLLFNDGEKIIQKDEEDFEDAPKEKKLFGFFEEGGETEEGVDLFEDYDDIPDNVQEILQKYDFEDADYRTLEKAKKDVETVGYTFEYSLDGTAYDLRKIGEKGKSEEYAKGGEIDWGADLGDGFSVGNDVKITDTSSRFWNKYGYLVGKIGQRLVVRVGNDEMDAVVSKDDVKKLDAPMAEGGKVLDLKDVYNDLRSKVGRLEIQEETKDYINCDIRDWGNWEHDYQDYERDEEDFEDDDFMILSESSGKKMQSIVEEIRNKYPTVSIKWNTSEKNYIDFNISRKMAMGGSTPRTVKLTLSDKDSYDYTYKQDGATASITFGFGKEPFQYEVKKISKSLEPLKQDILDAFTIQGIKQHEYKGGFSEAIKHLDTKVVYEDNFAKGGVTSKAGSPLKDTELSKMYQRLKTKKDEGSKLDANEEYALKKSEYLLKNKGLLKSNDKMADGGETKINLGVDKNGKPYKVGDIISLRAYMYEIMKDNDGKIILSQLDSYYAPFGKNYQVGSPQFNDILKQGVIFSNRRNKMAKGGKVKFEDKVKSIKASLLKRKKVSPKVQKDYGKTYSPKEAEESAKRIAGALRAKYDLKKK
jgi:hypothetical protein